MAVNEKELRRYLNVIKRAISLIEGMLENDDGGMLEQLMAPPQVAPLPVQSVAPVPQQPQQPPPSPPQDNVALREARKKHIAALMGIDCWPEAVPPFLCENKVSDEDQINRANAILDMMVDRNLEGKTFLDFGCGEGWLAQEASKRGLVEVVAYDIKIEPGWKKRKGVGFTDKFSDLPQIHFDFVMLYDVLDHCQDPVELMAQVRSCLKPEGVVYVRCHPWTARHGNHIYKQGINRAYWHLFLSWEELKELLNAEPMFTRAEKDPLQAYHWWFRDFGIEKERLIREDVSEFFFVPAFKELLANEQQVPLPEIDAFLDRMRIQFADYVLGPKK